MAVEKPRFAVYANTRGYYYYAEFQRLLACGLRVAGAQVVEADQNRGFVKSAAWHVIVAPHEFFHVGSGIGMRLGDWPPGVILYNCEPAGSRWFHRVGRLVPRAHAVWDMDLGLSRLAARDGWRSSHVPLGWVRGCELFDAVDKIPNLPMTKSLPPETRLTEPPKSAYEKRPLDLLFVGSRSERRDAFFAAAAPIVTRYRRFIRAVDDAPFLRPGIRAPLHTKALLGLAQRSKIALNIHRERFAHFEWHRMALHGIAQGALVLSEPAGEAPPFVPGRDYISTALADMPEAIEYYLSSEAGRAQAKSVAARGLRTYRESCGLKDALRPALAALGAPASSAAARAQGRVAAAMRMLVDRRALEEAGG